MKIPTRLNRSFHWLVPKASMIAVLASFGIIGAVKAGYIEYSSAVQALSPTAYWHLSENVSPASDVASNGTVADSGTYRNFQPANYQANNVWNLLGVPGGGDSAPAFAGVATSPNDSGTYLSVVDSADIYPKTTNTFSQTVLSDSTFAFWMRKADSSRRYILNWRSSTNDFHGLEWNASSRLSLLGRSGSSSNDISLTMTDSLAVNTLYHVVVSLNVDENNNTLTTGAIYINGVNQNVTTAMTDPDIATKPGFVLTPTTLNIGRWAGSGGTEAAGGGFYWNGLLDEVAIFNRALSAQDAQALYSAALIPEPSSVVLIIVGVIGLGASRKACIWERLRRVV